MREALMRAPRGINLGGLVVAGVGFFLTRLTISLDLYDTSLAFLTAGVVPLAAGLTVAAFGIALSVGAFEPWYARSVAIWCVVGTASMGVLVVMTLVGIDPMFDPGLMTVRTKTYLSNFLIGGCVGGTFTGVYAARNRRKRLAQTGQAKRMAVLNRVFRDRVLNAITVIRGRADVLTPGSSDPAVAEQALADIQDQTDDLEGTVTEIRQLTRGSSTEEMPVDEIDLLRCVRRSVERASERFPEAEITLDADEVAEPTAWASDRLERAFDRLIENAVVHNDSATPSVSVAVRERGERVTVAISDNGPGLPDEQCQLLESGSVEEYDDPSAGFGLNLVTLMVEGYGGDLDAAVDDTGTTVTVDLVAGTEAPPQIAGLAGTSGVPKARVAFVGLCGIVAGAVMGVVGNVLTDLIPVVGVLYGVSDPLVGWITHEFHSIVFAVVFAGLLRILPPRFSQDHAGRLTVALLWGATLWFLAVGFITPLWLTLLGLPASIPNLPLTGLVTHLVWGLTLGATFSIGLERFTWLQE
jgi:signal transduction histidine kinase